ncbi:hypothetical protein [Streptomyces mexicanus]|uniref:Uncharacterized protein n=1 Tax=Streptomyces mexicanus TaxID=178566 RepID=A0A7X1LUJ8_9ACTN|nr:hypothetical protein [Streptomyces mexicanus]MBC2869857.1 hypothetical protein [Streptomyces mexicanus]
MATPMPERGEPYADAAAEAVQTSVMAVRLVLAVADAVRRHQQRRNGKGEEELPPVEQSGSVAADSVTKLLPADISAALMQNAEWPQMAQQLVGLQRAGVDLGDFLPRLSEIAVSVRDAAMANAERVDREGTGEWERTLREMLPAGPVREAIVSSPTWPDIAAKMAEIDQRGVDVRKILASAHDEGVGVDQAIARVLAANPTPALSRDAKRTSGPLTIGLDVPSDLDLSDRERALNQLAIVEDNARYVRWVREAMPGYETAADALVIHEYWPLIAARMAKMETQGKPVREHLARLLQNTSWEDGPVSQLGARLVEAASETLQRPLGEGSASRAKVNTAAARAQSVTLDPTKRQGAKAAADAETVGIAHRQQSGPAPSRGKSR